ncbi:MAG TPA: 23S rRNA pseudouridine(2604) synthase RluF [Psychromonas sp.]
MDKSSEIRLNKFISDSGFCSRREADKLIEQNRVKINGEIPELGTKVQPGDLVLVDGKRINASAQDKVDRIYIAYNKPIGVTCTTERHVHGNIIDAIGHKKRIFPIGRLDKPSEGLIFLTSDGDIVNKILRAENAHDKEYVVTVDKPLSERFVERMQRGVPILDTVTKPCKVKVESRFVFSIILTQGLNRQIRRMCEYLGYEVTKLKRTRIMNVHLGNLKPGQWRNLTSAEMAEINQAVSYSSKTAINSAPAATARKIQQEGVRTLSAAVNKKNNQPAKTIFFNKKVNSTETQKSDGRTTLKLKRK